MKLIIILCNDDSVLSFSISIKNNQKNSIFVLVDANESLNSV